MRIGREAIAMADDEKPDACFAHDFVFHGPDGDMTYARLRLGVDLTEGHRPDARPVEAGSCQRVGPVTSWVPSTASRSRRAALSVPRAGVNQSSR